MNYCSSVLRAGSISMKQLRQHFPDIAFYYPNPMWANSDWVKSLVLFFEGIALLVPAYMGDHVLKSDPAIAAGLREHGLLHILRPETILDKTAAESLSTSLVEIISSGALDHLATERTAFRELSRSRLGYDADHRLAEMVFEELEKRGLAQRSKDGLSIPMHPLVRSMVLVLLAQILRPAGLDRGLNLLPATDMPDFGMALAELLNLEILPSAGHVVSTDLEEVGIDFGPVPIDEILSYRAEKGAEYRKYARDLHALVHRASLPSAPDFASELQARRQEIRDTADRLQEAARKQWKKPAAFALGLVGAAWTVKMGDPVGAAVGTLAAVLGADFGAAADVGAYSYLFGARRRFGA